MNYFKWAIFGSVISILVSAVVVWFLKPVFQELETLLGVNFVSGDRPADEVYVVFFIILALLFSVMLKRFFHGD